MNLFKRLFGKKKDNPSQLTFEETTATIQEDVVSPQIKKVPISQINPSAIAEGKTIVYQSEIPASCEIGNLIFDKKYEEAIALGLRLLKETPNDPGVHINLMEAYFKSRNTNPEYFAKSTYHAKQAILCGHHTGLAEERLAKNLEKEKLFHQSIQLYNLILDNADFHFSTHGMGNGIDFNKRRESALKKIDKSCDTAEDILFTPEEVSQIIQSVLDNDAAEEAQRKASEERLALLKKQVEQEINELRKSLKGSV